MLTVINRNKQVKKEHKRPKKTLSKTKTARVPFKDQPTKKLIIPQLYNSYNYNIGAVNKHNNITSQNAGLKPVIKEGYQAIEHWLFRVALVNSYLLSLYSDLEALREVKFRSQQDFRIQLINSLFHIAKDVQVSSKRRISYMSTNAQSSSATKYKIIKIKWRKDCVCYKGLRLKDRPQKRMALGEIAAN
jgi:hypothetical protein